jgi:urea transport system ATP-binding protein
VEERAEMAALLRRMAAETTIVITEHDFDFIKRVADRVTVLNKGATLAEGSVREIEANEAVRECYLGPADAGD